MAIDITNPASFSKLTLENLIADAVERKDTEALNWLKVEANTMKDRTRTDGSTYKVRKSIVEIRAVYVKKFLGYTTESEAAKERARKAKLDKAQKKIDDAFAKAFGDLGIEE